MKRKFRSEPKEDKWEVEPYDWGEIGKLKSDYKNSVDVDDKKIDQIKHREEGYWIFGSFVEGDSLAKIEDFELKYWTFKKNESFPHEPKFQIQSKEYNFIIEGKIRGRVRNTKNIILEAGDYIIIKPGEIVNLQQEIIENVKGLTIKMPSCHGDTIKKSHIEKLLNFEK